jgi:hypothetical protein
MDLMVNGVFISPPVAVASAVRLPLQMLLPICMQHQYVQRHEQRKHLHHLLEISPKIPPTPALSSSA